MKIQTDSYIAVQMLEQAGSISTKSMGLMAEQLLGSYAFSLLDEHENLYLAKGSNPLHIRHYPTRGLYIYASTEQVVKKAVKALRLKSHAHKIIPIHSGDIVMRTDLLQITFYI